jgi:hypothetical protein
MPLIKIRSSSLSDSIDFRGVPTASEWSQISTTGYVREQVSSLVGSSPELLNTLAELAASISTDENNAN